MWNISYVKGKRCFWGKVQMSKINIGVIKAQLFGEDFCLTGYKVQM